jgi:hypothetical protein
MRREQHAELFAAFKDGDGRPQLVDSAVLFLDILGTTAAAQDAGSSSVEADKRLRDPVQDMSDARDVAMLDVKGLYYATTYFSDNVVTAAPLRPGVNTEIIVGGLMVMAGRFQIALAAHGPFLVARWRLACTTWMRLTRSDPRFCRRWSSRSTGPSCRESY